MSARLVCIAEPHKAWHIARLRSESPNFDLSVTGLAGIDRTDRKLAESLLANATTFGHAV
jgi:hypothetical protein